MGLYCFWQSCANVSFISSFKDYFSSHKVVRGKAAQHTITIQRKCWDWKNNKLGCCRPQHVVRGTWHVSRPASFKLNNTADACPASCVHLPIRQAQLGPDQGQDRAPHLLESGTGNTSKVDLVKSQWDSMWYMKCINVNVKSETIKCNYVLSYTFSFLPWPGTLSISSLGRFLFQILCFLLINGRIY